MWQEHGGSDEAVATISTIGRPSTYVLVPRDGHVPHLGLVSHVDHDNYVMQSYEAH